MPDCGTGPESPVILTRTIAFKFIGTRTARRRTRSWPSIPPVSFGRVPSIRWKSPILCSWGTMTRRRSGRTEAWDIWCTSDLNRTGSRIPPTGRREKNGRARCRSRRMEPPQYPRSRLCHEGGGTLPFAVGCDMIPCERFRTPRRKRNAW